MNSKVEEELISEKDLFIQVELEKSGFWIFLIFFWNFESFNLFIYSSYTNNKTEKKTFIEIIRENEPPMLWIQNSIL